MIDTHTHLYLPEFEPSPASTVIRAIEAGVDKMVFPNIDLSTVAPMHELQSQFPSNIFLAMGLHPTEVGDDYKVVLDGIKEYLDGPFRYKAIGEVGIDLYWDKSKRNFQIDAFLTQCQWAVEMSLPVIIHCREGLDETLEVLKSLPEKPLCVFHSFGGTIEDVESIRRVGDFYFGINGIVTFKNSRLREVIPHIGIERILLETDSPYLAPVPMRGRRNESAYIVHIAAYIANILGLGAEQVDDITTKNAEQVFDI